MMILGDADSFLQNFIDCSIAMPAAEAKCMILPQTPCSYSLAGAEEICSYIGSRGLGLIVSEDSESAKSTEIVSPGLV